MTPIVVLALAAQGQLTYPIVDTNQRECYGTANGVIAAPAPGEPLAGQDAQHVGAQPHYKDNGDGTVSDLVTGLMWLKAPLGGEKQTFAGAKVKATECSVGGHSDWRLPSIKELYSLIDFSGGMALTPARPYINTDYFSFKYGDESSGERAIDSQYWSATEYVGRTMHGSPTVFGVNFADGRIKGYPRDRGPRGTARMWTMYVRGNPLYGINRLVDNGDGTVTDQASGLMWARADSGAGTDWPGALSYAEGLALGGHDDWRLPNAKELQSIVDYSHSPLAAEGDSRGPAISELFSMTDPNAYFWSSTTHLEGRPGSGGGAQAVYVAFGPAMGFMSARGGPGGPAGPGGPGGSGPEGVRPPRGERGRGPGAGGGRGERGGPDAPAPGDAAASATATDVHGAGAQRSDPKVGDPKDAEWARGHGPQGDDVRILNYARAVRTVAPATATAPSTPSSTSQATR